MISVNIKIKEVSEMEIISKEGLFHDSGKQNLIDYTPNFGSGIYFLYKKGKVVRIGQSVDIGKRLYHHDGKNIRSGTICHNDWDSFSFNPCSNKYDRLIYEAVYIAKYKPMLNKKPQSSI